MPVSPIVLAHGYLGFGTVGPLQYFNNVASILKAAGATQVFAPDVKPKALCGPARPSWRRPSRISFQAKRFT